MLTGHTKFYNILPTPCQLVQHNLETDVTKGLHLMSISTFYTLQMSRTGKCQLVMELHKVSLTSKIYNSEIYTPIQWCYAQNTRHTVTQKLHKPLAKHLCT